MDERLSGQPSHCGNNAVCPNEVEGFNCSGTAVSATNIKLQPLGSYIATHLAYP